jgi:hypothetical protein
VSKEKKESGKYSVVNTKQKDVVTDFKNLSGDNKTSASAEEVLKIN